MALANDQAKDLKLWPEKNLTEKRTGQKQSKRNLEAQHLDWKINTHEK